MLCKGAMEYETIRFATYARYLMNPGWLTPALTSGVKNAVAEKQDEYQNYVNQLMAQWEGKFNSVVAKQQGEAAKDYGEEMGKIMTVARRLMHGDQVPMQDEKKLMEYDKDLYIMAKNAGMMARLEKRKKYDSLWEDEEKKEHEDPMEAADAEEAFTAGPEVVSVESVMEAATGETESES